MFLVVYQICVLFFEKSLLLFFGTMIICSVSHSSIHIMLICGLIVSWQAFYPVEEIFTVKDGDILVSFMTIFSVIIALVRTCQEKRSWLLLFS